MRGFALAHYTCIQLYSKVCHQRNLKANAQGGLARGTGNRAKFVNLEAVRQGAVGFPAGFNEHKASQDRSLQISAAEWGTSILRCRTSILGSGGQALARL